MQRATSRALAGGTLFAAIATGYLMQFGLALPGTAQPTPTPETVTGITDTASVRATPVDVAPAALEIATAPVEPPAPATLGMPPVTPAAFESAQPTLPDLPVEPVPTAFDCAVTLDATPIAGALVRLSLEAPCHAGERLTLHHNGLRIADTADGAGRFEVDMPALSDPALFMVTFGARGGASAAVDVPSLPFYDRVVLHWQGAAGLELHAREFGADYFAEGHVWRDAAGSLEAAARGEGGFLVTLGDPDLEAPRLAQVYSFPAGTSRRGGDIAISVEAEITANNCGRDVEAQTLETRAGGRIAVSDLTLAMPDCDGAGDFLVLKNLIQDLKIAAN
ncbi:hypothetical protein [Roseivivax isoporae]|uniref:Translocase n=1 Tax=Roseivivax isoporae LMG 25204 TaxID=1449351 RepID=X7F4Q3_9RHOB|nr:hypothetical protein [Roseivivax isoporae]ETX27800.1 hypothetical protein RISW2_11405 [Roseivivax isoporae LMG 25204]